MGLKQMVAEKSKSCAVALPIACNRATFDETMDNSRNHKRNTEETNTLKPLKNIENMRNKQRNTSEIGQKTDAQLLLSKTPQKLRTVAGELRDKKACFQSGFPNEHSVISANYEKIVVTQSEPVKSTVSSNLSAPAFDQSRYQYLVTCQSCQHLSPCGVCRVKPLYKPNIAARYDCNRHQLLQEAREPVADAPYAPDELHFMLHRQEDRLLNHLVYCPDCRASDRRWCADGFAVGSLFDALLMCFDDADTRLDRLIDRVVKVRNRNR